MCYCLQNSTSFTPKSLKHFHIMLPLVIHYQNRFLLEYVSTTLWMRDHPSKCFFIRFGEYCKPDRASKISFRERTVLIIFNDYVSSIIHTNVLAILLNCFAGQLLNFNISLALILTLKHTATKLRRHSTIRRLFPLDDLLFLHKSVAYICVFLAWLHIVAHIINACRLSYLHVSL